MRIARCLALLGLVALLAGCGKDSNGPTAPSNNAPFAGTVEIVRARYSLPALGLAIVNRDAISVAVTGVRKLGAPTAATSTDLFHLGSLVKPMTATVIARLVEAGTLSWSLTLAQAFPDLAAGMNASYRNVTLRQLLQHRGGMPPFETLEDFAVLPVFTGDAVAQRREFVEWLVDRSPATSPGNYLYSNAGYAVAAAIAEEVTGTSWDQQMNTLLLGPLGISGTFGWPTDHDPNQPWGHVEQGDTLVAYDPALGRVPTVVAPSGDLSTSLAGYGRFAQLHLRALLGAPQLLADSTFDLLHTPPAGAYAMGWQRITLLGRTMLVHEGSAGTFAAFVLLDPERQGAYVLVTNALSVDVPDAFSDLLTAVLPKFAALPVETSGRLLDARTARLHHAGRHADRH